MKFPGELYEVRTERARRDLAYAALPAERPPAEQQGYYELEHLGLLPGLLERLESMSNLAPVRSEAE